MLHLVETNKESFKGRDISVYFLKFLAVLLITNSHFDKFYISFPSLATGGAIGDALFFFCSGFTIFLGREMRFDNWYKRRISRIYPAVFAWAFVAAVFFGNKATFDRILISGGGWFVSCIMIYYAILYFVKRYFKNHLVIVSSISVVIVILWYIFLYDTKEHVWLYKENYFKWCFFFLFMLLGGILGKRRNSVTSKPFFDTVCLIFSIIFFYGLQIIGTKCLIISYLQPITIIPLLFIIYFLWRLMNTKTILSLFEYKWVRSIVIFIGGLCLEIYLSQMVLIHFLPPYINQLHPLNIPLAAIIIIIMGYITHIIAQWFSQTFSGADYDWRSIFVVK